MEDVEKMREISEEVEEEKGWTDLVAEGEERFVPPVPTRLSGVPSCLKPLCSACLVSLFQAGGKVLEIPVGL
jgi:hypothetical protein